MIEFISQKGQDDWVIRDVFNYKTRGYFVDLAATDGIKINNTYLMESKLDWEGICIEPSPLFFDQLKKNRNCNLSNDVIDYKNDNEVIFRIDNGELGGIVDDDTDNNYRIRAEQLKEATTITKKTKTLEFILNKFNAPSVIDYLSLDVEGAESRVLKDFAFDKYTFLSLTIERPIVELENALFDNDYVFVMKSKKKNFDSFYVHKSIPNFEDIPKEKYSPTPIKDW
jgi:FkbM family methyltransferase